MPKDERRETVRIENRSSVLHREFMLAEDKPPFVEDVLEDISVDGLSFHTNAEYVQDSLLEVRLMLHGWEKHKTEFYIGDPRRATDPLVALAKVMSCRETDNGRRKVGAHFENIDPSHHAALTRYLDMLSKREL